MASKTGKITPLFRIAWLRSELRVRDNAVLAAAAEGGATVLPLVVFEPREFGFRAKSPRGPAHCKKTGAFRARFVLESVIDLRRNLQEHCGGAPLLVAHGEPGPVIRAAVDALLAKAPSPSVEVVCAAAPCWEEQQAEEAVEAALASTTATLRRVHEGTLYHPDDLRSVAKLTMPGALHDVFTPWRNRVEKANTPVRPADGVAFLNWTEGGTQAQREAVAAAAAAVATAAATSLGQEYLLAMTGKDVSVAGRADVEAAPPVVAGLEYVPALATLLGWPLVPGIEGDAATAATPDMRGDFFAPVGGETSALLRLQRYVFDEDRLREYFETRNGMMGQGYSTKLAPWLARGCISPRQVYAACKQYEKQRGIANKSTYWVIFELTWRDYFVYYAQKHGRQLFFAYGVYGAPRNGQAGWLSPEDRDVAVSTRALELLNAWKAGTTGVPLIDANMRELAATGFMSNRGRQNVASFLALDLNVDWRYGAEHFEELLVDFTPEANYGNWHAAAGLSGGRVNRFNPVKQGKDYDAEGAYVKLWCPELANVPASKIHEPWMMSRSEQLSSQCVIGTDYPAPISKPHRYGGSADTASPARGGKDKHAKPESRKHQRDHNNGGKQSAAAASKNKRAKQKAGRQQNAHRVQNAWASSPDATSD